MGPGGIYLLRTSESDRALRQAIDHFLWVQVLFFWEKVNTGCLCLAAPVVVALVIVREWCSEWLPCKKLSLLKACQKISCI